MGSTNLWELNISSPSSLSMTSLLTLPDDILLLLLRQWHSAIALSFAHSRLHDLKRQVDISEHDWRMELYRYGIGRSLIDAQAGRSWASLANAVIWHCNICTLCFDRLRRSSMLDDRYAVLWTADNAD